MNIEIVTDEINYGILASYPVFPECKRLTKYYAKVNSSLISFLRSRDLNVPVEIKFNITHNSDTIISLYRDIYIGTSFIRISDTWAKGYPVSLKSLGFKKKEILHRCISEADTLSRSGYIQLFQEYPKLIHKNFRPECFYIQDGYPVIFFQPGILAGKSHGIISFKMESFFEIKL